MDLDYEERKRRQMIRVLVAELGMVFSIIVIVVVATLAAMGFFISSNGQIEQAGLMQLHSVPTGASVELDGVALFPRTNLSRTMVAGEHTLKLTKDGYDSWEKTVTMYSGILMRLYYPRLFLQERTVEEVMTLSNIVGARASDLEFYQVAPSRNYVLYGFRGEGVWYLVDLRGDTVKRVAIGVSSTKKDVPGEVNGVGSTKKEASNKVGEAEDAKKEVSGGGAGADNAKNKAVSEGAEAGKESVNSRKGDAEAAGKDGVDTWKEIVVGAGTVEVVEWSRNDERVIVKMRDGDAVRWLLVDVKNPKDVVDLGKLFGQDFEKIVVIDESANRLYALASGQIRKLDIGTHTMSRVLVDEVVDFEAVGANLVYYSRKHQVGTYRDNDEEPVVIAELASEAQVRVMLGKYYDDDYICYFENGKLTILYGALPSYRAAKALLEGGGEYNAEALGLTELMEPIELGWVPEKAVLNLGTDYVVAVRGKERRVIHLDRGQLYSYAAITDELNWLDASMFYAVMDGEIVVWDFDGTNVRNLAESRAEGQKVRALGAGVMITANNRWLYYLIEEEEGVKLVRERIVG